MVGVWPDGGGTIPTILEVGACSDASSPIGRGAGSVGFGPGIQHTTEDDNKLELAGEKRLQPRPVKQVVPVPGTQAQQSPSNRLGDKAEVLSVTHKGYQRSCMRA